MTCQEPAAFDADPSRRAVVRSRALAWLPSPTPGVERCMLERDGMFSDERGDHPAGTDVRNPPGSARRTTATSGCSPWLKTGHLAEV